MYQKTKYKNRKYLDWVKTQPSVISGQPADDPHHVIGHGMGGTGMKAPDWAVIPLTREEHTELHNIGWKRWEDMHGSQLEHAARIMGQAITEGVLK